MILTIGHLKPSSLVRQGFKHSEQQQLEKISIKTRFGEIGGFVDFLVMDIDATYKALLGHTWMHKNAIIPSNLSPMCQILSTSQGIIPADIGPFLEQKPIMRTLILIGLQITKKRGGGG